MPDWTTNRTTDRIKDQITNRTTDRTMAYTADRTTDYTADRATEHTAPSERVAVVNEVDAIVVLRKYVTYRALPYHTYRIGPDPTANRTTYHTAPSDRVAVVDKLDAIVIAERKRHAPYPTVPYHTGLARTRPRTGPRTNPRTGHTDHTADCTSWTPHLVIELP